MPKNSPTNRIEVDLKLLQDKNAEKLIQFGKQFETSVEKLSTALADYAGQLAGAAGTTRAASGASTTASTPGKVADAMSGTTRPKPTGQVIGEARGGVLPPGGNYGWETPGTASVAQPLGDGAAGAGVAGAQGGGFEQQYVKATRRIGAIPTGLRQMLGFIGEGGQQFPTGHPMAGQPVSAMRRGASKAADSLFWAQSAQARLAGHFAQMNQAIYTGQDVGYSRSGAFGLPFGLGSPAMREGIKNQLKSMWSGKFGFNPNYTPDQAAHARSVINEFGYGGDTADFAAEKLKQLEIHQRLSPEASMRLLDPAMRFGNVEMSQLTDTLNAMPAAARAARMNLKQFNEEVTQLAAQLSQNGPASATSYAAQLTAFSAVTGLSPEKGAAMLQDRSQTFMEMGMTGMSYAKATISPNALAGRLKAPMMIGNQLAQSYGFKDMGALSKSYEDLQAGRKIDPRAENALSSLGIMIDSNPELFGGMNLKELMNNARRGNVLGRTEAASQLTLLGDKASDKDFRRLIGLAGMGQKGIHGYEVDRAAFVKGKLRDKEAKYMIDHHGKQMSEARRQALISEHEQQYLQSAFGKKAGAKGRAAATQTIGLTDDAAKLVKLMDKANQGGGNSNQHRDAVMYARRARGGAAVVAGEGR